ncbi:SRPBCC family protein [Arthrobacter sp. C9C5]|uniref:SRPBCC family protein n=1 Tax=Arthrobacter sp. C9C5 TaxID=2735267 RepID=UPI001585040B|nr:SRPBCC family protein [Arthrobacter sp. C9C5]NUU33166.1 SRPBCC family protein [Arthrobacter sp. C9C5]
MGHIKLDTQIDAPVGRVTEIAVDPYHWASWWVNLSEPKKVEGDGRAGTVVEHSYLMAGVPFPVTTRVLENEPTASGGQHVRLEFDGPLKGWQTWDYEPSGTGTRVTAEIEYNVPGAAIGKFADRVLVERLQERAREQTLANLKLMAETGKG